jgi:hypothetical protein
MPGRPDYIRSRELAYSKAYDAGCKRTGCMFCLFGFHSDPGRLDRLAKSHPKIHDYCMKSLGLEEVLKWYPPAVVEKKKMMARPVMDFLRPPGSATGEGDPMRI